MLNPILPSDLITLKEATFIVPRRHSGKRVTSNTIRRWGISGRITLYQSNGLKVSESQLRSVFKVRVLRGGV